MVVHLPIDFQAKKKGNSFLSRHIICGLGEETISHIFMSCHFVGMLWTSYAFFWQAKDASILDLWTIAMKTNLWSQISNLWKVEIVSIIWVI